MNRILLILFVFSSTVSVAQIKYDHGGLVPPGAAPSFVVGGNWNKTNITYFFQNGTADINANDERGAVIQALQIWATYAPLTFTEVFSAGAADIVISWGTGNHGDNTPFDGINGVLAHAYYPGSGLGGDLHFDDAETWTLAQQPFGFQPIDLVTVAAHEIGHSLGLDHSNVACALMNEFYTGSHRYLAPDDIAGIRFLYGNRNPITVTNHTCSGANVAINGVLGDGPTVTWTSNNAGIATVDGSGAVTRTGDGVVRITANIALPCGLTVTEFRDIPVGVPPPIQSWTTLTNYCLGGSDWELMVQANAAPNLPPGSLYVWSRDGFEGGPTNSNTYYTYEFPPSCLTLGVRMQNACGSSVRSDAMFCPPCGGLMTSVSPNPASSHLSVQFKENASADAKSGGRIQFQLYDLVRGVNAKTWWVNGGQSTYRLDLAEVKKGNYVLHVIKGTKKESHKVIVK